MIALELLPYPENSLFTSPQKFDLNENTSISYTIANPIFEDDFKQGSASRQFSLPHTSRNQMLLGFPERLGARTKRLYDVNMLLGNQKFTNPKLAYNGYSGGKYKVRVLSELTNISNELGNQELRNFIKSPTSPHIILDTDIDIYNALEASELFRFPRVHIPEFYTEAQLLPNFEGWINDTKHSFFGGKGGLAKTLTPMFRVPALVRLILEQMGYSVTGSFFEDTEIQNVCLFASHQIDSNFTDINANNRIVITDYSNHLPNKVKVFDFLNAVKKTFCITFNFKTQRHIELNFRSDLLNSNNVLNWSDKVANIKDINEENRLYKVGYANGSEKTEKEVNDATMANISGHSTLFSTQTVGNYNGTKENEYDLSIPFLPLRYNPNKPQEITTGFGVVGTSDNYPIFDQDGKPVENQNETIRFIHYRGSGIANEINAATTSHVSGFQYGFNILGSGGIAKASKIFGNWLRFLTNTKTLGLYLELFTSDLLNLNPNEQIVRIENFNYVLKWLKFNVDNRSSASQSIACEAELMQIPIL